MFSLPDWLRQRSQEKNGISLGREDNERLNQFARSVRRVRMSRSLLGLAWTAGPVTAVGLYGGYYIGFGQAPSNQLLVYFISFTILSGLIALVAKIVYDSTMGFATERAQLSIVEVTDKLGDLILATRDLMISNLDGEVRERAAATQLLQRVDLPPVGVAMACEQLTGDAELGRLLASIDNFRRAGLYSRIADIHQAHGEHFESVIAGLHQTAPQSADVLRQRYLGDIANLRHGMPRTEHFISRVLAAIEQDNLLLITMQDVESMLVLCFELINGREIPMLMFDYRGRWRLAAALDRMERRRSRYRIAQAAGSNRIRGLASWLVEVDVMSYDDVPEGLSSGLLVDRVGHALDALALGIRKDVDAIRKGNASLRPKLRRDAEIMASALRLYRISHESFKRIGELHAEFLLTVEGWNRMMADAHLDDEELQIGPRGRGVRIREKVVRLDEEERKEVCRILARYLREQHLESHETKGLFERRSDKDNPLTFDNARQLVIEVALALEPHIQLSFPDIQRGIGSTLETYLGDLEPGMSAKDKKLLAESMAQDVVEDMSHAAEHLAVALVRHYRVNLTDEASQFLQETYGARKSVLDILSQHQGADEVSQSLLTSRPAVVPPAQRRWYRALVHAKRIVGGERFIPLWVDRQ
ncbi:MAG: hypothetical protein CMQ34_05270 [Gammaproteobacteria bacterium]|nr:hypothetical protein [Gammaproteobacteria bacterium]|tara:strand:- start:84 stop:2018 length:1935 start_codon:yes stop_codon:yes gene_type:complete